MCILCIFYLYRPGEVTGCLDLLESLNCPTCCPTCPDIWNTAFCGLPQCKKPTVMAKSLRMRCPRCCPNCRNPRQRAMCHLLPFCQGPSTPPPTTEPPCPDCCWDACWEGSQADKDQCYQAVELSTNLREVSQCHRRWSAKIACRL